MRAGESEGGHVREYRTDAFSFAVTGEEDGERKREREDLYGHNGRESKEKWGSEAERK